MDTKEKKPGTSGAITKRVVLIPIERGEKSESKNRRRAQRRMAVPRRVQSKRRGDERLPGSDRTEDRRTSGDRRRLPDRRLGLKIDLDVTGLK